MKKRNKYTNFAIYHYVGKCYEEAMRISFDDKPLRAATIVRRISASIFPCAKFIFIRSFKDNSKNWHATYMTKNRIAGKNYYIEVW